MQKTFRVPVAREQPDEEDFEEYEEDGYEDPEEEETEEVQELDTEEEFVEGHAYIPDADYAVNYVHRKVRGINDFDLLDYCRNSAVNLLLAGDTGAGKTMLPMAYAAENAVAYYSVPCDVSIDPRALFGKMMPTDTVGEFEWVDGPVTEMVRFGGVLNFSEINSMPPKIAFSLYQLLDHRRALTLLEHKGETIRAHGPNCWCEEDLDVCQSKWLLIVADMNPKYRGTGDLNLAFANRFGIRVPWGYLDEVENSLVKSKELLDLVRKLRKMTEIRTPIGTNMMMEFVRFACDLGVEFATGNFVEKFADAEKDPVAKLMDVASVNIKIDIQSIQTGKRPDELLNEMPEDPEWLQDMNEDDYDYDMAPAASGG